MKKILSYLLAAITLCGLNACTDGDPKPIEIEKGKTDFKVAANQTYGEINFTAADDWSAYVTASRSEDYIDWLMLNTSYGYAGESTLTFTLEENTTGKSRTAYITIACSDYEVTIKVTQTTKQSNDDDEGDEPLPCEPVNAKEMYGQWLEIYFSAGRLTSWEGNAFNYNSKYGNVESIVGNMATVNFEYLGERIIAKATNGVVYEIEGGIHQAYRIRINHLDGDVTDWDLEYSGGHMSKCTQYNNGMVYETSTLYWVDDDLCYIMNEYNGGTTAIEITYSDKENTAKIMEYDAQFWVDLDDASIFYYLGILGEATQHLPASLIATEIDNGGNEYNYESTFAYKLDSKNRPTRLTVKESRNGKPHSEDSIDYTWADKY